MSSLLGFKGPYLNNLHSRFLFPSREPLTMFLILYVRMSFHFICMYECRGQRKKTFYNVGSPVSTSSWGKAIFPQGAISSTHQLNGRIVLICTTRAIQMLIIFNLNTKYHGGKSHTTQSKENISIFRAVT